jgi:hypothetical protein
MLAESTVLKYLTAVPQNDLNSNGNFEKGMTLVC